MNFNNLTKLIKSIGIYTLSNALIAILGIALTFGIGWNLGANHFGKFASFIALQNIWASLGLMRLETRIGKCKSKIEAHKIILSGFLIGFLITIFSCGISFILFNSQKNISLIFLSGFSLSVLDSFVMLNAFSGQHKNVIKIRSLRIILPLLVVFLFTFYFKASIENSIIISSLTSILSVILIFGRWPSIIFWTNISKNSINKYWKQLIPSLLFCILNGIWINGLIPYLNEVLSSSIAAQFAMTQRVLGGVFGVISTGVAMHYTKKELVEVKKKEFRTLFVSTIGILVLTAILIYLPINLGSTFLSKKGWNITFNFYCSISFFLICSYSVSAVSITALRVNDEWFLVYWQAAGLFIWWILFFFFIPILALNIALIFGSIMYLLLSLRWYKLLKF